MALAARMNPTKIHGRQVMDMTRLRSPAKGR
jgi:hypothetical protein